MNYLNNVELIIMHTTTLDRHLHPMRLIHLTNLQYLQHMPINRLMYRVQQIVQYYQTQVPQCITYSRGNSLRLFCFACCSVTVHLANGDVMSVCARRSIDFAE